MTPFEEIGLIIAKCNSLPSIKHISLPDVENRPSIEKAVIYAKQGQFGYDDILEIGKLLPLKNTLEGEKLVGSTWVINKLNVAKIKEARRK